MKKHRMKWKTILIAIIMIPLMAFFPACACGSTDNDNQYDPQQANTTYTVHFYTGTQSSFNIPNQIVAHGGLVRKPSEDPIKPGYIFIGWYRDMECTISWTFLVDTVTSNMTLYAGWHKRQY